MPPIAIISASLQQKLFSTGTAVGRRIRLGVDRKLQAVEVVGVVSDAAVVDVRDRHVPVAYRPFLQTPARVPILHVRTAGSLAALDRPIRATVKALGHEYVRLIYATDDWIDRTLLQQRLLAVLSSVFAALALLLAALGVYGLLAVAGSRRRREIGIRIALGSSAGAVTRLILQQAAVPLGIGVVVGMCVARWLGRLIAALLYGVQPYDPRTLIAVSLFLWFAGVIAGYVSARRAARVDPMVALRAE
jgi:ABC-type antimicrobial peptide transport system permease subunit